MIRIAGDVPKRVRRPEDARAMQGSGIKLLALTWRPSGWNLAMPNWLRGSDRSLLGINPAYTV